MRFFTFIFLLIFCITNITLAQPPCSGPGRTAQTAIAVCGILTFQQSSVTSCTGPDLPFNGCTTLLTSSNSVWYKFHCYQSGTLSFLLKPNTFSDDYDWQIMDHTGRPPGSVYNVNLGISINLSGQPGPTGCTAAGTLNINCAGGSPGTQFNIMPNLIAGHDYLLMVNNYVNSQSGYDLDFAGGTAVLTNNQPPAITNVGIVGCDASLLKINFSEDVLCSSLTTLGSEFTITGGTHTITSITSTCNTNAFSFTELTLVLQNPMLPGNYRITVNNGTDANTLLDVCQDAMPVGSFFDFTVPTQLTPVINQINSTGCAPRVLQVILNKPVLCSSITTTGSEFSITPGTHAISSVQSACGSGAVYIDTLDIVLQNPLPFGNYQLVINNGTDGNTIFDTCGIMIPVGYNFPFVILQTTTAPVVDSVQFDPCGPDFIKVFYSNPILCSSVSANGSDFFVTGPSAVNIVSATTDVTCTQGYTNWVLLQFASPINVIGNYVLHNGTGTDGNGILDTCYVNQNTAETHSFNASVKPPALFNSQVKWGCIKDTILLSHPGGNGANSWTWNFSDGSSAVGQTVSHTFPVTTPTVTVQLIVSNGTCTDSVTNTIALGNSFKAGFTNSPVDSFCINTPVTFTDTSRGNISNYLWDFGDLTQFNGQNPPAHVYPVSKDYNIKLIVTDIYGCKDTASKTRYVTPAAFIDFTGLKPQYCTGNQVLLTRKISRFMSSYIWDNGDGKTFTNEVDVNFSYAKEGVYTITLSGVDRYCGTATMSKIVPVYEVPKVKLGADTILCQAERILIGVTPNANYTYLWSTGATAPQIYTDIFTRDYILTADNNGCRGTDAMHIKVLPVCLIKVPGAFTPNRDGLNDELKALNADLAKNFSFKVYNRLGQLVFSTNNPLEGWNGILKGNPASSGTYVWMLSYIDPWNGKPVHEKGTSILLR